MASGSRELIFLGSIMSSVDDSWESVRRSGNGRVSVFRVSTVWFCGLL